MFLRFTIFYISGVKNFLSDCCSRFPSGVSGNDSGDALTSTHKVGSTGKAFSVSSGSREDCWPPTELPRDAQSDYPQIAQIFAYGAMGPACDADSQDDELSESDDYVIQSMLEVASLHC